MPEIGGLLGGGEGGGAGMAPTGFRPGEQPEEEEEANVSPEEQQQYDAFVENAMEVIYTDDGKVEPEVLKRLSTGKKPIDTMAQTVVWVVTMTETDAKQNNMAIDDDVLFHAAREIMEQLVEVSEAAGLHEWKEAEIQGAWYNALDMYREANSDEAGRFDPEVAKQAFGELQAADAEGRGDDVLPGFSVQSERAIAMAKQDQNPVEEEEPEEKTLSARSLGK